MDNSAQRRGMDSPSCTSLFSCGFFVAVAAMVAAAAVSLLPGLGAAQTVLHASGRVALVVIVMSLAFSGALLSTLLNVPNTTRVTLVVLFATALLCSGFVALVGWFAVSGASSCSV
jgi:hypothetical protein